VKNINIFGRSGFFAQDKDIARDIRIKEIVPFLENNEDVVLDFSGVGGATQSFIHALISDVLRRYGGSVLAHIEFKSCNEEIRQIINIVIDYMEE
jgi:hypothetical protein